MDYSLQVSAFVCRFVFWIRSHLCYGVHDRLLIGFISKLRTSQGGVAAFRAPSDCNNQLVLRALTLAADLIVSADLVCVPHSEGNGPAEGKTIAGEGYIELGQILIELRNSHWVRYFWLRCQLADSPYSSVLEELAHYHPSEVDLAQCLVKLRHHLAFSR